eukprot:jgi/Bigna1/73744/fgenesh1_pg.25_\
MDDHSHLRKMKSPLVDITNKKACVENFAKVEDNIAEPNINDIMESFKKMTLDLFKKQVVNTKASVVPQKDIYLSLEGYLEAVKRKDVKPYQGSKFKSIEERYSYGWAYNLRTRRWAKPKSLKRFPYPLPEAGVESSSKADIDGAVHSNETKDEQLTNIEIKIREMKASILGVLAAQKKEVKNNEAAKKAEVKDNETAKEPKKKQDPITATSLLMSSGENEASIDKELGGKLNMKCDVIFVLDTCWILEYFSPRQFPRFRNCFHFQKQQQHGKRSMFLIPKAVMRELDGLKKDTRQLGYEARNAHRVLYSEMAKRGGPKSSSPSSVVVGQMDHMYFKDDGYHKFPTMLRGDDSILNCCMFLSRTEGAHVRLCTLDKNLALRAKIEQIQTIDHVVDIQRIVATTLPEKFWVYTSKRKKWVLAKLRKWNSEGLHFSYFPIGRRIPVKLKVCNDHMSRYTYSGAACPKSNPSSHGFCSGCHP